MRSTFSLPDVGAGLAYAPAQALKIVMFGGPADWGGVWYSRHQLSAGLARRHRVVLVDEPAEWRLALRRPRSLTHSSRLDAEPVGTLRYSHPGWLPRIHRGRSLRRALDRLRSRVLCRRVRALGAGAAIAYAWHPEHVEAVASLSSWPLVYHAYDRYGRYTGASEEEGRARETWLVKRASVCIAASLRLAEHLQGLGARDVRLLRHGIDPAFLPPVRPADALAGVPRPRLGLVASLSDAVDYRALLHVARTRADWSLVIVGHKAFTSEQKRRQYDELEGMPNVYSMGFRPREEVPAWISGLDVALTCYDLTTWAPFNQPLKLYEYLACGVPVVSSDILAAEELGDLVLRVPSLDRWVPAIEAAIATNTPALCERRRAFARENSWERRIADLEQVLIQLAGEAHA